MNEALYKTYYIVLLLALTFVFCTVLVLGPGSLLYLMFGGGGGGGVSLFWLFRLLSLPLVLYKIAIMGFTSTDLILYFFFSRKVGSPLPLVKCHY